MTGWVRLRVQVLQAMLRGWRATAQHGIIHSNPPSSTNSISLSVLFCSSLSVLIFHCSSHSPSLFYLMYLSAPPCLFLSFPVSVLRVTTIFLPVLSFLILHIGLGLSVLVTVFLLSFSVLACLSLVSPSVFGHFWYLCCSLNAQLDLVCQIVRLGSVAPAKSSSPCDQRNPQPSHDPNHSPGVQSIPEKKTSLG